MLHCAQKKHDYLTSGIAIKFYNVGVISIDGSLKECTQSIVINVHLRKDPMQLMIPAYLLMWSGQDLEGSYVIYLLAAV